jgi:hypothetical protein
MSNQQTQQTTNVTTGRVRGSYVSIFKPRVNTLSNPPREEYSMTLLIPKTDVKTVSAIREKIKLAIAKKWGDKPPHGLKLPLKDGDDPDLGKGDAAYKGMFFLRVSSREAPTILDAGRNPVMDAKAFVSGDYCFAAINAFAYETRNQQNVVISKGVSFGLNHVMIAGKGEPLTGRQSAEDAFADVDPSMMDNTDI